MCFKCTKSYHKSFGKKQLMRKGGGEVEQRVLAGSGKCEHNCPIYHHRLLKWQK